MQLTSELGPHILLTEFCMFQDMIFSESLRTTVVLTANEEANMCTFFHRKIEDLFVNWL